MYYTVIHAHNNYLTIAIVDNQDELVSEKGRVPIGDGEPLLATLKEPRPLEAVVETGSFWPSIHDRLEPTEAGFHLAHASRLKAIAQSETKTNSVDAKLLARMLATDLVPEVYPSRQSSGSCTGWSVPGGRWSRSAPPSTPGCRGTCNNTDSRSAGASFKASRVGPGSERKHSSG